MLFTASRLAPAALVLSLLPVAASAELLSATHYADELQRCVAEIRAELEATEGRDMGDLRHEVVGLERERQWYEFEIRTVTAAAPVSATVCRAHRYQVRTELATDPADSALQQLAQSD